MTAKHNLHVAALIPPHLTPQDVIAALQDHNTALTLQSLTTSHKKLPSTDPEIRRDTYWYPPDLHAITTYSVTECIVMVPGVGEWAKRYITFPSCFQNTPHGIKTRADAPGGVTLRAEFRVIPGGSGDGEVDGEGEGVGDAEWVLVEDVEVQCAWWMMPFVRGKMEGAHRGICRKVVEKVEMLKLQEQVAQTGVKGKARADEEVERPPVMSNRSRGLRDDDDWEETEDRLPDKITYG